MPSAGAHHLTLRLTGGPADQQRVSVGDLLTVAGQLQAAVRNVAAVLAGRPSGSGGRKLKAIEAATELLVVAEPRGGSFVLDLELAPAPPTLPGIVDRRLGEEALEAFVEGLRRLDPDADTLPRGFDRGVLRNLERMAPVFSKRYDAIELGLNNAGEEKPARVDPQAIDTVRGLIAKPIRSQVTVEGVLQMVDLAANPLQCRVDRPYLPGVLCLIPHEWEAKVRNALRHRVRVEGEGEFDPQGNEPKRVWVTQLEVLPDVAGIDPDEIRRHWTWQDLALEQGVAPLARASDLEADLFEDDDDVTQFLQSLRTGSSPSQNG